MPKLKKEEAPEALQPYLFHGLDLNSGAKEATADCPFCGREGKFSVNIESGMFRCLVCGEKGNQYVFIRRLFEESMKATYETRKFDSLLSALLAERSILEEKTAQTWGLCRSISTPNWLLAGYGVDGKLNQLYRYVNIPGRKFMWLPTPTLGHQIHGPFPLSRSCKTIHVCEGPWDGMVWWETLGHSARASVEEQESGHQHNYTPDPKRSLRSGIGVIAVPGCETFLEGWADLLAGREVVLLYDSDHPRENPKTGQTTPPAGWSGVQRVGEILQAAKHPPEVVKYLRWGEQGYDPDLESGTDIRDVIKSETDPAERVRMLSLLLAHVVELFSVAEKGETNGSHLQTLPCTSYKELVTCWRKAMKWTEGLDHALSAMLASVLSTRQVGDQLWLKVIGPASCGKSTLCEAIAVATKYVHSVSTLRGFHSGTDDGSGEDYSLITKLKDKTLVTKDGDTLLQAPNLGQILSEARDIYDTVSRSSYRTRQGGREYLGVRMTWLLCGTSSLRSLDSSELGERFLDCVIMEEIEDDLEDEVLLRVAHKARRCVVITADKKPESQEDPLTIKVRQLTGGYVEYLRQNASDLLSQIEVSDDVLRECAYLGKFVAHIRARPSLRQNETAEREFAARLTSQLVRLANCLTVVLNRKSIDEMVMERVRKIALDTARGHTLEICRVIRETPDGAANGAISIQTGIPETDVRKLTKFLQRIKVLQCVTSPVKGLDRKRYLLTERFEKLWERIFGPPPEKLN